MTGSSIWWKGFMEALGSGQRQILYLEVAKLVLRSRPSRMTMENCSTLVHRARSIQGGRGIPRDQLFTRMMTSSILRICAKTRDGERPLQEWRRTCSRPSTTWVHQICRDTGVSATRGPAASWRTIATVGGSD